ncbi:hypothetical protein BBI11_14430 [Planococcus maritimus]|nr:hypothetical protein BBI11_14430 [Planococcus maritimus]
MWRIEAASQKLFEHFLNNVNKINKTREPNSWLAGFGIRQKHSSKNNPALMSSGRRIAFRKNIRGNT